MKNIELEKSKSHLLADTVAYVLNTMSCNVMIKKATGSIVTMSFDKGVGLKENISRFDTFSLIIEGNAELMLDGITINLKTGEAIIIPAHTSHFIKPNGRFKMVQTIIKSGYE